MTVAILGLTVLMDLERYKKRHGVKDKEPSIPMAIVMLFSGAVMFSLTLGLGLGLLGTVGCPLIVFVTAFGLAGLSAVAVILPSLLTLVAGIIKYCIKASKKKNKNTPEEISNHS